LIDSKDFLPNSIRLSKKREVSVPRMVTIEVKVTEKMEEQI
jgi:hypothetical protein